MAVVTLTKAQDVDVDGVWVLTLNDPDRRNAMSLQLLAELRASIQQVRDDSTARVLVLAATGPAFSAGADLQEMFGDGSASVSELRDSIGKGADSFLSLRDLEIPTIAAVHGPAVGAGVIMSMACDFRIAGPDASFGVSFTRLGLHPGGGCTHYLVEALGRQRAFALLLEGGKVNAQEALALGIVLEVVNDPLAAALARASGYAKLDPSLVRHMKTSVSIASHGDWDRTLEFESWAQAESATTKQVRAAIAKFARK
jgi:enoyl-CoA hydratase